MNSFDYSYETFKEVNPYLSLLMFIILMLAMLALYFLPSIIAMMRGHPQKWLLAGLNVFAGWTGVFWIGLLVWALWPKDALASSAGTATRMDTGGGMGGGWGPYQAHDRAQGFNGPATPAAGPGDTLEQLHRLKERGILTEEEFTQAKARLLGQL